MFESFTCVCAYTWWYSDSLSIEARGRGVHPTRVRETRGVPMATTKDPPLPSDIGDCVVLRVQTKVRFTTRRGLGAEEKEAARDGEGDDDDKGGGAAAKEGDGKKKGGGWGLGKSKAGWSSTHHSCIPPLNSRRRRRLNRGLI